MAAEERIVRVLIASPGGLERERDVVERVIAETERRLPIGAPFSFRVLRWEDQPPEFGRPQGNLNPMARVCWVFVGLLADRWGSPTGTHSSGFYEEFTIARDRRRKSADRLPHLWLFFSSSVQPSTAAREQYDKVIEFKSGLKERREALIKDFADCDDLEHKLLDAFTRFAMELQTSLGPDKTGLIGQTSQEIRAGSVPPVSNAPREPGQAPDRPNEQLPAGWHDALVAGPLEHAGMSEPEAAARECEAGDPGRAAALYAEVADGLLGTGYEPLANIYAQRAADLYAQVHDNARAATVLTDVLRREIQSGSERAPYTAHHLLELMPEGQRWRARALEAIADWPSALGEATERLHTAIEHLRSDSVESENDEQLEFTAALIELLCIGERFQKALEISDALDDVPLSVGPRLRIALDRIDAVEAVHGPAAADAGWCRVREFVDGLDEGGEAAAAAWQRRGVVLTERGDVADAREAFRQAVRCWRRVAGFDDQVREAYFASQVVGALNGQFSPEGEAIRPWAASLRGHENTPAHRADRLEEAGMSYRLRKKFPDALRSYWLAYAEHRRVGNLRGQMFCLELLGELNVTADHLGDAVWTYLRAGKDGEAASAARAAPMQEVGDALDVGRVRWRRAASCSVIAAVGRTLPHEVLASIQEPILAEAQRDVESLVGPEPIVRAQEALAAIVFGVAPEVRDQAIQRLRELALDLFIGSTRPAIDALILLTNAHVSDETETLLEAFLDDSALRGVSPIWLGERLTDHPDAAAAVILAAKSGGRDALQVAAVAGLPEHDHGLAAACASNVQIVIDSEPMETVHEDGRSYRRVGMGGYEMSGVLAKFCPAQMRVAFAEKMSSIMLDDDLPLMNRASAANALFNVAGALDGQQANRLAYAIMPILVGKFDLSDWDPAGPPDAFARFQISQPGPGYLQGSALSAWSMLRRQADDDPARDERIILDALASGTPSVVAAALDALARMSHVPMPSAVIAGLMHPESEVRASAIGTQISRNHTAPPEPLLSRLVQDESVNVRLTLLIHADQLSAEARRDLLERFTSDRDAYVRAFAEARLLTA